MKQKINRIFLYLYLCAYLALLGYGVIYLMLSEGVRNSPIDMFSHWEGLFRPFALCLSIFMIVAIFLSLLFTKQKGTPLTIVTLISIMNMATGIITGPMLETNFSMSLFLIYLLGPQPFLFDLGTATFSPPFEGSTFYIIWAIFVLWSVVYQLKLPVAKSRFSE